MNSKAKEEINRAYGNAVGNAVRLYDVSNLYPDMSRPYSFTMWDVLRFRNKNVKVTHYVRAIGCKIPTVLHMWGKGTWLSWFLAWHTNPSGQQKCGCLFEYGEI